MRWSWKGEERTYTDGTFDRWAAQVSKQVNKGAGLRLISTKTVCCLLGVSISLQVLILQGNEKASGLEVCVQVLHVYVHVPSKGTHT